MALSIVWRHGRQFLGINYTFWKCVAGKIDDCDFPNISVDGTCTINKVGVALIPHAPIFCTGRPQRTKSDAPRTYIVYMYHQNLMLTLDFDQVSNHFCLIRPLYLLTLRSIDGGLTPHTKRQQYRRVYELAGKVHDVVRAFSRHWNPSKFCSVSKFDLSQWNCRELRFFTAKWSFIAFSR